MPAPTPEYVSGWLARGEADAALADAECAGHHCESGCGHSAAAAIRAIAPPVQQIERPTDANGVWLPPDLYKAACALDALIHSTPDMSGDLRDVRLTGGPKKISDAVRAFKWALSAPPVSDDRRGTDGCRFGCGLPSFHPGECVPLVIDGKTEKQAIDEDRLLLLKALLLGEVEEILFDEEGAPEADLYWRNGERETVKIDSEGFPILTDSLRAALTEATHG